MSMPSEVSVTLNGPLNLLEKSSEDIGLTHKMASNTTTVVFALKDGLSSEIVLKEDREQNSLPWLEDFVMAEETVIENGLSSWRMETFDAQEIGYAYVKGNDFWMSGINCNWQSGVIDISGVEDASILVRARCDQPKRLNSNDSLNIYYKVDSAERILMHKWVDDFEAETIELKGIKGNALRISIEGRSDRNSAAYVIEQVAVAKAIYAISKLEFTENKMGRYKRSK